MKPDTTMLRKNEFWALEAGNYRRKRIGQVDARLLPGIFLPMRA